MIAELAAWTAKTCPHVTAVGVGTSPIITPGRPRPRTSPFGMATAVEYLAGDDRGRAGHRHGSPANLFNISLGTHHFLAIAKLRAARRLWARVVEACGGSAAAGMRSHANRQARADAARPVRQLAAKYRLAVFAAGRRRGGAITSVPFDSVGEPDDSAGESLATRVWCCRRKRICIG